MPLASKMKVSVAFGCESLVHTKKTVFFVTSTSKTFTARPGFPSPRAVNRSLNIVSIAVFPLCVVYVPLPFSLSYTWTKESSV